MVADILRDSFFGSSCRFITGGRVLKYPEELQPEIWQRYLAGQSTPNNPSATAGPTPKTQGGPKHSGPDRVTGKTDDAINEKSSSAPSVPPEQVPMRSRDLYGEQAGENGVSVEQTSWSSTKSSDHVTDMNPISEQQRVHNDIVSSLDWEIEQKASLYIVSWFGSNDQANPQNWSSIKKAFVTFEICLLTFTIYIAAAILSPAITDFSNFFHISHELAISGLSLFLTGYGFGPLLWSPLSRVPAIGRTSIYILTLAAFTALQVPTALAPNITSLLVCRFIAGFIGSPSLVMGAGSIAEMYTPMKATYGIALWGLCAATGPVLGPLVGGFAVAARGWRWSIWSLLCISSFTLALLVFFLPETSAASILHRRARRLRKLTGNESVVCEADIEDVDVRLVLYDAFVKPFTVMATEPIVLVLNAYTAFIYGLLYLWFESFRIVFGQIYGFDLGTSGLMFLGILIGAVVTLGFYFFWLHRSIEPRVARHRDLVPEWILPPSCIGAIALPVCLFWFGWTSRESIPWIVPVLGTVLFAVGTVLIFNAVLNYLVLVYRARAPPIWAGNHLIRSLVAASFSLFRAYIYARLGVEWATSLLGSIAVAFVPVPFVLVKFGKYLRNKSKTARHDM